MFSIIDLAGSRPDKLEPGDIQLIKDFVIGASPNIKNKMLTNEKKYNVNIKLAPLSKKVVNVANSDPLMSFPIMTTAHVNTGLHGSFKYPTTVDINLPFLLDPINGMGGENYKQRLNKMLEYIKIYKIVKTQLEAYALATPPGTTPDDIKKARTKVSSQYVEFLPDTAYDIDTIDQFEDPNMTEDEIETATKFFLNPKSTVSSGIPVPPKPTATAPSATATAPSATPATPTATVTTKPTSSGPIVGPTPSTKLSKKMCIERTRGWLRSLKIMDEKENIINKDGLSKEIYVNYIDLNKKSGLTKEQIDDCLINLGVEIPKVTFGTVSRIYPTDPVPTPSATTATTSRLKKSSDVDTSIVFESDEEDINDKITELNNKYNGLMKTTNLVNKKASPLPTDKEKEFTNLMNEYQKLVNSGKLSESDKKNTQLIIGRLNNAITTKNFILGGSRTYY